MYVHPFAMASCGHRGHDGSHESEPLVRLNAQKELGNRRTVERSPVFCLCRSIAMPRTGWSPNTVPYGADQTAYLVVDRFSGGSVYRETEIERADLETIISDFMTGQFNDPVRVIAFNTLEHWADDVSEDIAQEVQTRCDIAGEPVPEHLRDFVENYAPTTRQLALRLV